MSCVIAIHILMVKRVERKKQTNIFSYNIRGSQLKKINLNISFFFERTFSVYFFCPIISHEYFQGFLQIFVIDYPHFFVRNLI